MSRKDRVSTGKFFALSHRGFVEVRESASEPKKEISYLTRRYWDGWLGRTQTRRLPVISFSGGKVIGSVNPRTFGKISGHTLRPGTSWEISFELVEKLKEVMK